MGGALLLVGVFGVPAILFLVGCAGSRRAGLIAAWIGFLAGVLVLAQLGDPPPSSGSPVDAYNIGRDLEKFYGGALVLVFSLVLGVRMMFRPTPEEAS